MTKTTNSPVNNVQKDKFKFVLLNIVTLWFISVNQKMFKCYGNKPITTVEITVSINTSMF